MAIGPTYTINAPIAGDKTVVVLGAFRGGTSMIAAAVDALGIPMGESKGDDPVNGYDNWEDLEIQRILHAGGEFIGPILEHGNFQLDKVEQMRQHLSAFVALIQTRNSSLRSWGWKYPGTVLWVLATNLLNRLRNPHVITVFRDPFAVWQHETRSNAAKLVPANFRGQHRSFGYSTVQSEMLIRASRKIECPHLVVSYERANKDKESKERLIEELLNFLQLPKDESKKQLALERMRA